MEPFMEDTIPGPWSEIGGMDKGPWAFQEGSSCMPEMMECAGGTHESNSAPISYAYVQHMKPHIPPHILSNVPAHIPPHIYEDSTGAAVVPLHQEAYSAIRGVPADMVPIANQLLTSSSPPFPPHTPFPRGYGRDRPNRARSWCQSFINRPRERSTPTDIDSPGEEESQDKVDGRNVNNDNQICGSTGMIRALGFQPVQTDGQQLHDQMHGGQVYMPLFETYMGEAQPQSAAVVVAGAARPRVRARRGQATDPHSIAERLRRERITERMKALQELVPNANKTDKASMLDEIIDYVKFLQLQVKVLSMSRLGGTGAPFMSDFPAEGQSSLLAGAFAGPMSAINDSIAMAERQVARLMEEDMGSAMQFLQGKGLCLMPVSVAGQIASNSSNARGQQRQQAVSAMLGEQSRMQAAASSTTTCSNTIASVASSVCAAGDGDS